MSEDRDQDSVVTASADGISVEKRFERDRFAVPAIEFTIRSDRDEPASVRLVDHVPEEFPMDSVGFHPDFENDNWTAFKDHRVEFERDFDPGEEVVTVYGVRLSETEDASDFMGEPELTAVAGGADVPPDPLASVSDGPQSPMDGNTITDIVSEQGNQVVRDVIAGETDTLPGLGDDPAESAEGATDADPLADPLADAGADADESSVEADPPGEPAIELPGETDVLGESVDEPAGEPEPADDPEPVEPADVAVEPTEADDGELLTAEPDLPASGTVAAALAEEIRQGSVSDADLSVLRQELDVTLPESTNVRIRHLQSRVEDFAAYTEALEEFIDENGTASRVLDEFEASVEAIRDEQAETRERIDALAADFETVSGNLDGTQERIDDVRDDLADVRDHEAEIESIREELTGLDDLEERLEAIDELRTDVAAVRGEFEELEELVGANTDDVTALGETLANVEEALAGVADVEGDLAAIDERVESLADSVSATERSLESAVSDLQADVESITDDVEEIRAWRDQLKGVFGAGDES